MDTFVSRKDVPQPNAQVIPASCAKIVSAYVGHNPVPAGSLPQLVADVQGALRSLDRAAPAARSDQPVPAVELGKSVTSDYIICLEDGKRFKMLKRHLRVHYGMTPDEYRRKWGLAPNYPMVAQNYASRRAQLAKLSGSAAGRKEAVG